MIRKNKGLNLQMINPSQNNLINYRNAIYQGQRNELNNQRQGAGIIYIPNKHRFLSCNSFSQNNFNGMSLFYHSHSKFCYGLWRKNMPQSINIFRIQQILIIAEYDKGYMKAGSIIIFIFQKYSMGVAIQITDGNSYQIKQKKQIISNDQILQLLQECNFDLNQKDELNFSLIKFLNINFHTNSQEMIKLRLINNKYYRFGYDKGLAIMFDDQYQILSMGHHVKNKLVGVGIKYNSQEMGYRIEEGIFDGDHTKIFDISNRPQENMALLYSRMHLSSLNFINHHYKDPSQQYFNQFEHLLETSFFKEAFYNLVLNNSLNDSFRKMMESEKKHDSYKYYQRLQMKQLQIPTFKRLDRHAPLQRSSIRQSLSQSKSNLKNPNTSNVSKQFHDNSREKDIIEINSREVIKKQFEDLTQKNRLQILKRQLYDSIKSKKHHNKLQSSQIRQQNKLLKQNDEKKFSKIINMQQASRKHLAQRKKSNIYIQDDKNLNQIEEIVKIPNLDQRINIIIRQEQPEDKLESKSIFHQTSKSISKKRIFDQKPIMRDYTPEKPASPFKHRIKSRIFENTPSRSRSRSRSRSNRKIFTNQRSKTGLSPNEEEKMKFQKSISSPHQNLYLSLQKSLNQSSKAEHYPLPITINNNTPKKYTKRYQQGDEIGQQIHNQPKTLSKFNLNSKEDYKFSQDNDRSNLQKSFKKSNMVYMNQTNKQCYYQPIKIRQSGNSAYRKNESLSKSIKSNIQSSVAYQKKHIDQSSPMKARMHKYLNTQVVQLQRYSNYKKRTSYF